MDQWPFSASLIRADRADGHFYPGILCSFVEPTKHFIRKVQAWQENKRRFPNKHEVQLLFLRQIGHDLYRQITQSGLRLLKRDVNCFAAILNLLLNLRNRSLEFGKLARKFRLIQRLTLRHKFPLGFLQFGFAGSELTLKRTSLFIEQFPHSGRASRGSQNPV